AGDVAREGGGVERGGWLASALPRADLLDGSGALGVGDGGLRLLLLPELVGGVLGCEVAVRMREGRGDLPERLGLVGAALELALDDQTEGRALHPSHREEVRAETPGGGGDRPGQRRSPDQVHVLTGRTGVGERIGELVEV